MSNELISTPTEVNRRMVNPLQDVNVVPTTSSTASSAGLVSVVVICMTIMAICALVYFAIRCYFDERRWRASALLCKCLPPDSAASLVECGNPCRYVERRAVNVAVQTSVVPSSAPPELASATNCWPMSDVRISEAKRVSSCAFSSPLANNNDAIPNWRPPATGSSQRQGSDYHQQKSSQRQKHRNHRQSQRQYYREVQHHQDEEFHHYPLRRVRPVPMMPTIQVQSPSSSESYSVLAMSSTKSAALNKEFTAVTFSGSDDDDGMSHIHHLHQYSKSRLSEGHNSYGSTNPYHPRYNTPVSEVNNNDVEVVVAAVDIEQFVPVVEIEEEVNGQGRVQIRSGITNNFVDRMVDRKWSRSSCSVADGMSTSAENSATAPSAATTTTTTTTTAATTVQLVDEATQSCQSSVSGFMGGNLKGCQTSRTNSSCSLNIVSTGFGLPLDIVRSGLPVKETFPSFEILPGGRLISRRTQTDNASLASLDWDYGNDRFRSETDVVNLDNDDFGEGDGYYHRLTNVDEGVEGMTSSATMLASSHASADMTLQASHISQRSTSSPYVLCFECSDEFVLGHGRRPSSEFFFPRHTSSSSPASRANRRYQRSLAPPSPPPPPNLSALSPPHSSHHSLPDSQDGRSSKAVRPRRK